MVGLAGVKADVDMVVRHIPQFDSILLSEAASGKEALVSQEKRIIRYQGTSHTFNYISYFKFFMPDGVKKEEI